MQAGDFIRVIRDSNGEQMKGWFMHQTFSGITFETIADEKVWFMPWHSVRMIELVSESERRGERKEA